MTAFKLEYSKYRHKKSIRNKEEKIRHEELDISNEDEESKQDTKIINNDSEYCQSNVDRKKEAKEVFENLESFRYEDISFDELPKNKVRCGICKVECGRLIVHLNFSKKCAEYISDMASFKIRLRSKKTVAKEKAQDPKGFKEKENERKRKKEGKQKLEDLKGFNEKANKRKMTHVAKKKAEVLKNKLVK